MAMRTEKLITKSCLLNNLVDGYKNGLPKANQISFVLVEQEEVV